eukprot:7335321-Pyramimonas_sp.AAC.1
MQMLETCNTQGTKGTQNKWWIFMTHDTWWVRGMARYSWRGAVSTMAHTCTLPTRAQHDNNAHISYVYTARGAILSSAPV